MTPFTEEYYMRGISAGVSNYENYSWKPELTIPVVKLITNYLGAAKGASFLDYGCARGYYVKALRRLGFYAFGYDISGWAIENCDPAVRGYLANVYPPCQRTYDFVLCKDVLEHIPEERIDGVLRSFMEVALRAAIIIVPLATEVSELSYSKAEDAARPVCTKCKKPYARPNNAWNDEYGLLGWSEFQCRKCKVGRVPFVSPIDEADSTHKIAWTLTRWISHIQNVIDTSGLAFTVSGGYKIPGVKKSADPYPQSCGFLTIRRFEL